MVTCRWEAVVLRSVLLYSFSSTSTVPPGTTVDDGTTACTSGGGTLPASCETSGAVGTCNRTEKGDGYTTSVTITYYSGTAEEVEQACSSAGGVWSAGSNGVDGGADAGVCSQTGFDVSASATGYRLDKNKQQGVWTFGGQDSDGSPNNLVDVENWIAFGGPEVAGTYGFGAAETDYSTCGFCLLVYKTCMGEPPCMKAFMPKAQGSYTLTTLGSVAGSHFAGSVSGVVMQEVTIDSSTFATTAVVGGETWCLDPFNWDGLVTVETPDGGVGNDGGSDGGNADGA